MRFLHLSPRPIATRASAARRRPRGRIRLTGSGSSDRAQDASSQACPPRAPSHLVPHRGSRRSPAPRRRPRRSRHRGIRATPVATDPYLETHRRARGGIGRVWRSQRRYPAALQVRPRARRGRRNRRHRVAREGAAAFPRVRADRKCVASRFRAVSRLRRATTGESRRREPKLLRGRVATSLHPAVKTEAALLRPPFRTTPARPVPKEAGARRRHRPRR